MGSRVHIGLLRGVNVGGKNRLPMKDLAEMFRDAGCENVTTYIQSGNVLFEASGALAARVPGLVGSAVAREFGFEARIVTRSRAEMEAVVRGNPFVEGETDPGPLHVAFLMSRPATSAVAALDPDRSPPDRFVVRGREVYLHCPNGMGRTKLTTTWLDAKLETTSTVRNWKTVLKLLELARAS